MKTFIIALVSSACCVFNASALPKPMPPEDMLKECDLFARLKIGHVAEVRQVQAGAVTVPFSEGEAEVLEVYQTKHTPPVAKGDMIKVCWQETTPGMLGQWSVPFQKDETTKVYLKFAADSNCYKALSWNAKSN